MLLNKTKCLCGKELLDAPFSEYVPNKDVEFYGGRVSMIAKHTCECGRKLNGFFEVNTNGNLKLIDLEEIPVEEECIEPIEVVPVEVSEEPLEETQEEVEEIIEIEEVEEEGDKYIEEETKIDLNETSCEEKVDFTTLSYKELQEYAKSQGIEKVNVKREELIEKLSL